jgi:galactosamine-6-phosphate isomerase
MIKLHVFADHEELSHGAADHLVGVIRDRPDSLLCLATGATPTLAYELLAKRRFDDPGLFDRVRIVKLDEWGGLDADDPATCEQYLRRSLIDVLGLEERFVSFSTGPVDPWAECRRITAWLDQNGPIDTCVLGLGLNGHLGFNEPATELMPRAHVARLSAASLSHSMLDWARKRPTHGLTLGMADLLQSRRIMLLVSGQAKQAPLSRALEGPISTRFPASFLQLHSDVTIFCDVASRPQ